MQLYICCCGDRLRANFKRVSYLSRDELFVLRYELSYGRFRLKAEMRLYLWGDIALQLVTFCLFEHGRADSLFSTKTKSIDHWNIK